MNWVDIIILVLFAYSLFSGMRQGVIQQFFSLASFVVAHIGATIALDHALPLVGSAVGAYLLLFLLFFLAARLLGRLLRGVVRATPLSLIDRLGGGLVSALLLALLLSLLVVMYVYLSEKSPSLPALPSDSVVLPHLQALGRTITRTGLF